MRDTQDTPPFPDDEPEIESAHDLQDPLPESSFFYRRVFSYLTCIALTALLAFIIYRMDDPTSLRDVALYLCVLLFFTITYYMVAPSGEQVVKMVQTAKMLISGVRVRHDDYNEGTRYTHRPGRRWGRSRQDRSDFAPTSRRRGD